ncbi:3-isopropylmalate dehydratase large subunit [Deltaproteobacteria bacterium OttesenSCG-928-K17]|nr:3-isopropylmalate dehydratase large subunit [Deltaproteobacteria bacterium OttesenSCG-928-K17]
MMSSLLDKIWEPHVVDRSEGQPDLLYIDRHLVHEVTSPQAFEALRAAGRKLRRPDLTLAVMDHAVPTCDRRRPLKDKVAEAQVAAIEKNSKEFGFSLFGLDDARQGVIHVTMPEQGFILPGLTIVCGDSHTATHGAFGALAFGIGTSEIEHVLASQTLRQTRPKLMAVEFGGDLAGGASAKDIILAVINTLGVAGGTGYALEYRGPALARLSMAERMTISNMSIECGAKMGLMAPDETTFAFIKGRPFAPAGADWDKAVAAWRGLKSDADTVFDKTVKIDLAALEPRVTWGTNPAQSTNVGGRVPAPADFSDAVERQAAEKALAYQKLKSGTMMSDVPVDYVFIGSCTNARLEDLRVAAGVLKGRKIKPGVVMLVSPGSGLVKAAAEKEGLDKIFIEAGAQWREPGCSMCLGMNPDVLPAGKRSASTSNRNFEDRQGRGGLTHLVGPATAAASAVAGCFADPRQYL